MSALFRGVESMAAFLLVMLAGGIVLPFYLLRGAWALACLVAQHGMVKGFDRWEP